LTSRDDPRPERLHAPPRPLGVQPARRPGPDQRARRPRAEQLGFDSLALTDHGALYGAVAFYQACATARRASSRSSESRRTSRAGRCRQGGQGRRQPFHLVLLASDWTGYQNLCRLITAAHLDGYYYKPRIDREHLARYSEGLIGLSACLGGEIPRPSRSTTGSWPRRVAGEYGDIFGKGNFFLELQDHGLPEQRRLNEQLLRLAPEAGLPLVATNDLHYVRREQAEAHDVLLCVGTASNLDTPGRMKFETQDFYLKSAAEMAALFADVPQAIANTRAIAEMTNLELPAGQDAPAGFPGPRRPHGRVMAAQRV
jgi:DNA polymerase-3 subunit alpha